MGGGDLNYTNLGIMVGDLIRGRPLQAYGLPAYARFDNGAWPTGRFEHDAK